MQNIIRESLKAISAATNEDHDAVFWRGMTDLQRILSGHVEEEKDAVYKNK